MRLARSFSEIPSYFLVSVFIILLCDGVSAETAYTII
jgi:hypothetical protein